MQILKKEIPVLLCLVLLSCGEQTNKTTDAAITDSSNVKARSLPEDSVLVGLTKEILTRIKNRDYTALANYMHPDSGIRFSPYGYIDQRDLRFSREKFLTALNQQPVLQWGFYEGSGDSILLTVRAYFDKFVYDVDFLNAEFTSINQIKAPETSLNNMPAYYTDVVFTESYFSGFEKKYDGMDWRSLRLLYKKYRDRFYLVGIIHGAWSP